MQLNPEMFLLCQPGTTNDKMLFVIDLGFGYAVIPNQVTFLFTLCFYLCINFNRCLFLLQAFQIHLDLMDTPQLWSVLITKLVLSAFQVEHQSLQSQLIFNSF